jgi:hypothetical protein
LVKRVLSGLCLKGPYGPVEDFKRQGNAQDFEMLVRSARHSRGLDPNDDEGQEKSAQDLERHIGSAPHSRGPYGPFGDFQRQEQYVQNLARCVVAQKLARRIGTTGQLGSSQGLVDVFERQDKIVRDCERSTRSARRSRGPPDPNDDERQ